MNRPVIKEIQLHSNDLTFTALSSGSGTPVFLLHGFPDTPHTWEHQIVTLAQAGYRVIAPNCRGYEPSSQPANKDYSQLTLARDVLNWMNHLGIKKAHLVGHDWGASIAQTTAQLAPERCYSLTIMAVPPVRRFLQSTLSSIQQLRNSAYMGFFQLRHIAERRVQQNNFDLLDKLWRKWSPGLTGTDQRVKQTFAQAGVTAAALSYYRQALSLRHYRKHSRLFKTAFTLPTLAIYGKTDGCVDQRIFLKSLRQKDFANELQVIGIDNAGHFMNIEQPDAVSHLLVDWVKRHTPE